MVAALAVQASIPLAALVASDRGFAWRGAFGCLYAASLAGLAGLAIGPDALWAAVARAGPFYEAAAAYGIF